MADFLNGIIFSEFLADNSEFAPGFDTDGDGQHNKSDEYIELQNTTGSAISLEGYQVWSDDRGLLYEFGVGDTIAPGQTATIVGEYTGTPPAGYYDAGLSEGQNFLEDGQDTQNDTIYLVDPSTGDYIVFSYGDPVQPPSPPTGFTGTNQIGSGESLQSGAPNGVAFVRDANGDWVEGSADPGNPGTACYAAGTVIETPDGPRRIETLGAGDLIMTLDNGPQTVLWVRQECRPLDRARKDLKPILISAGALGSGIPASDLIVSPQHRILVGGQRQLEARFNTELFAPAKSLTSLRRIRPMLGKRNITWVHFACKRHEVVIANGCHTESLLLGPLVINALSENERLTIAGLFGRRAPEDIALNGPPALTCLTVSAARRHLRSSIKNTKDNRACKSSKLDQDKAWLTRREAVGLHGTQASAFDGLS